jgi:hypothetical protein
MRMFPTSGAVGTSNVRMLSSQEMVGTSNMRTLPSSELVGTSNLNMRSSPLAQQPASHSTVRMLPPFNVVGTSHLNTRPSYVSNVSDLPSPEMVGDSQLNIPTRATGTSQLDMLTSPGTITSPGVRRQSFEAGTSQSPVDWVALMRMLPSPPSGAPGRNLDFNYIRNGLRALLDLCPTSQASTSSTSSLEQPVHDVRPLLQPQTTMSSTIMSSTRSIGQTMSGEARATPVAAVPTRMPESIHPSDGMLQSTPVGSTSDGSQHGWVVPEEIPARCRVLT